MKTIDNDEKEIVDVSLLVWGDSLDPEHVSMALNTRPTRSHLKGEEKQLKSGNNRIMKSGYWELDTEKVVESSSLMDRTNYLIEILKSSKKEIKMIAGCEGAAISFTLGASSDGSIEFILDSKTLNEIAQLDVGLHFVVI